MAMFDWLDSIGKGIGSFGADADKFIKREMPFDSGWGAPAAAVAAYFGGPAVISALGEGAGALGGESALGAGGFGDYLGSLGVEDGGFSGAGDFGINGINPATGMDWAETGSGLTGNGYGGGYTPQEQAGLDNLINQQSAKYPMDSSAKTNKPTFQQLLGKQLMSGAMGGMGGSKQGYQYQEQPIQRQGAFLPVAQAPAIQEKKADIEALISALRSKGAFNG